MGGHAMSKEIGGAGWVGEAYRPTPTTWVPAEAGRDTSYRQHLGRPQELPNDAVQSAPSMSRSTAVTTIAAWAGHDQRGISSLNIVSDSRVTWLPSKRPQRWDRGRKTFACRTQPFIFGYWGDVGFPAMALPQVIETMDASLIRLVPNRPYGAVGSLLRRVWLDYPTTLRSDSHILVAHRLGIGMRSVFSLAVFSYVAETGTWTRTSPAMPSDSAKLLIEGSGAPAMRKAKQLWDASVHGNTSRAVYSAFCEGLRSGEDPNSGGGPQVVSLRRIGNGLTFGTVYNSQRYYAGARVRRTDVAPGVEWFNELYERVDGSTMRRLPGAQRHQPRE
jgi:hypothetical protein